MTHKWTYRYQLKADRWVFVPTNEAKGVGASIKRLVEGKWKVPEYYFHLRKGGHVAAVRSHSENTYFFRADLDDFFGRVNRSRVTRCLKSWFPYMEARAMASESVVKRPSTEDFILPYGFVQSPILASLALDMSKLGRFLGKLHRRSDVTVSVYVDDIIVSCNDEAQLFQIADLLNQKADESNFPLSLSKKEGPAPEITAFNIELSHGVMRITEERLALLRAEYLSATSEYSKNGIYGYVESVNIGQIENLV